VLPSSAVAWNNPSDALAAAARERLARLPWDALGRSARLLRQLLDGLAGASARLTRGLERVARRLAGVERAAGLHACPLLPADWLVEAEDEPAPKVDVVPCRPPPIPAAARRAEAGGPPCLLLAPASLVSAAGALSPPA
jgi:hypothetical protein